MRKLILAALALTLISTSYARGFGGGMFGNSEKYQERYNNASSEEKKCMDLRKSKVESKAKELGYDLTSTEGKKKFREYMRENRPGKGMSREERKEMRKERYNSASSEEKACMDLMKSKRKNGGYGKGKHGKKGHGRMGRMECKS